jgi:hypothetical protein
MQIKMTDEQRGIVERLFAAGGDQSVLDSKEAEAIKNLRYRLGLNSGEILGFCRFDFKVVKID